MSTPDIQAAVDAAWERTDVLVMTAAVADYRPAEAATQKLKKRDDDLQLDLVRTTDVLATTATMPGREHKVVVGFAAETEHVEAHARRKLVAKGLCAIVANDVSQSGSGFGTGDNAGWLVTPQETTPLERAPKTRFAEAIVAGLMPLIEARRHD